MTDRLHRHNGFTLMEVLMAVIAVAILAAVSVPSYVRTVEQQRQARAEVLLRNIRGAEQVYQSINGVYAANLADLQLTDISGANDFSYGIESASDVNFLARATRLNGTAYDLTIDAPGNLLASAGAPRPYGGGGGGAPSAGYIPPTPPGDGGGVPVTAPVVDPTPVAIPIPRSPISSDPSPITGSPVTPPSPIVPIAPITGNPGPIAGTPAPTAPTTPIESVPTVPTTPVVGAPGTDPGNRDDYQPPAAPTGPIATDPELSTGGGGGTTLSPEDGLVFDGTSVRRPPP